MRRGKTTIFLLTILFAAVAVLFGRNEIGARNFPFSVTVTSDGVQEEIHCMKIVNDYYMFLPSYAQKETARIRINPIYDVYIEGQQLTESQPCTDFPENTKLELYFRSLENEGYETITFVRSANVATMYIDVPSGNMDYIHAEKGNSEPGWIRVYTEDGTLNHAGSLETIKGRGNLTWLDAKKPYSLELSQEADILSLGKASRWILLSNSHDHSHLRNKIALDMAQAVNMLYSPGCTWTDLYLNGEYAGLYLLSERNEVHSQRVDINADRSFLVAIEPDWRMDLQGYTYVQTDDGTALRIHHSTIPQNTLLQIWQTAENAIFAEDGYDPATGKRWDELIDIDSWARKYLIEEILANTDVGLASEFFFYDESDGVIYAGPIWDMDVTLSDTSEPWLSHRAIIAGRPRLTSPTDRHFFYELLQKQAFRDRVEELYRVEFRPILNQLLNGGLEEYAQTTAQAALSNQERWKTLDPEKMVAQIEVFLQKRMDFLDDYWIHGQQFFLVQVQQYNRVWAFAVCPGETLEDLPEFENGIWCRMDTDEIFDKTLPVNSDLELYFKENIQS